MSHENEDTYPRLRPSTQCRVPLTTRLERALCLFRCFMSSTLCSPNGPGTVDG